MSSKISNIYGWNSIEDVAIDIWSGIHSYLLRGDFVFGYKGSGDLLQLVVSKDRISNLYSIGMITSGWTMLLPKTTKDYLLETTSLDMKAKKVPSEIIKNFIEIINNDKNEYFSN